MTTIKTYLVIKNYLILNDYNKKLFPTTFVVMTQVSQECIKLHCSFIHSCETCVKIDFPLARTTGKTPLPSKKKDSPPSTHRLYRQGNCFTHFGVSIFYRLYDFILLHCLVRRFSLKDWCRDIILKTILFFFCVCACGGGGVSR